VVKKALISVGFAIGLTMLGSLTLTETMPWMLGWSASALAVGLYAAELIPKKWIKSDKTRIALAAPVLIAGVLIAYLARPDHGSEPPAGFRTYEGSGYSAYFPADWRVDQDEHRLDGEEVRRTAFASPDGETRIVIDWTPGDHASPRSRARHTEHGLLEQQRAGDLKYRRLTMASVHIRGRPAVAWVFKLPPDRKVKVDYVRSMGGSSFAVLGTGIDPSDVRRLTLRVAESIEPK
jgi:hypothetical protein